MRIGATTYLFLAAVPFLLLAACQGDGTFETTDSAGLKSESAPAFQAAAEDEPAREEMAPDAARREPPGLSGPVGGTRASACDPTADALLPAGYDEETNTAILLNGQKVTPAGQTLDLEKFAWGLALSPDGRYAYVTNAANQGLQVIDLRPEPEPDGDAEAEITETVGRDGEAPLPITIQRLAGLSVGHGLAVSADGATVYVSGGGREVVRAFDVGVDGLLTLDREITVFGYADGMALAPDGQSLYVVSPTASLLIKVKLTDDSTEEVKVGNYPYDVVVTPDGETAYVSNWAGGSVYAVDTGTMAVTDRIEVDKNPEGMVLVEGGDYLIVTNSDADNLSIVETASNTVTQTIELDPNPDTANLKAWTPNAAAVHPAPDAHRAYVASADRNAIEVIDTDEWRILGQVPTAMYPVRVELTSDGKDVVVVNAKGWGSRLGQTSGQGLYSVLQVVATPKNAAELAGYTTQVENNNNRPRGFFPLDECESLVPLPLNEGEKSVIEHVILVVKENKTYDDVLGDLLGEEGDDWHDPELARLFGEAVIQDGEEVSVTPNAHAIARTWVDMVNFYSDAEVSLQGHMWTTQGDCNDYVEKLRFDRLPVTGVDPATKHYNKSIFEHLDRHGVNFRVYGEVVNFAIEELVKWRDKIDLKYPYWSQSVTDVNKAREIIREWELAADPDSPAGAESLFPPFIYIVLPNDHTEGGKAGVPSPRSMVADNDHGMGLLLEWLSHSPFWEKSLFIAIEDDPQSANGDHIDAHRSVCFLASPWIKRGGEMITTHYSIPSLYRTIEMILGLPPMNKNTLMAPPMVDIFTNVPDNIKYTAIVPTMPLIINGEGRFAEEAKRWDWSTFDGHKGLGEHIWRIYMGDKPQPPQGKRIDD